MCAALICPDELFWVEQRGAGRVGFDGYNCRAKGSTTLHQNEEKPVGLAIDSDEKVMFWSNDQNAKPGDSWLSKVCRVPACVVPRRSVPSLFLDC